MTRGFHGKKVLLKSLKVDDFLGWDADMFRFRVFFSFFFG